VVVRNLFDSNKKVGRWFASEGREWFQPVWVLVSVFGLVTVLGNIFRSHRYPEAIAARFIGITYRIYSQDREAAQLREW
jgi:hypothetical protein